MTLMQCTRCVKLILYMFTTRVVSAGGGRGKLPPPPPKLLACDSTYHNIIRIAFLSSIMPALITQELKFSLFKLNQILKCLNFVLCAGGGTSPSCIHPLGIQCQRGLPPPKKIRILDRTLTTLKWETLQITN